MRLFLLSVTAQGEDMNFSWEETAEMQRRLNILWNVARFPLPYMRADDFDPEETTVEDLRDDLELVDEWVLSRLQSVTEAMTDSMDDFENDKAVDELLEFVVEDVSRFYIQVVRERMWEEEDSASKQAAYATLYRVPNPWPRVAPSRRSSPSRCTAHSPATPATRRSTCATGPRSTPTCTTPHSNAKSRSSARSRRRARMPASRPNASSAGPSPASSSTWTATTWPMRSAHRKPSSPTGSTPAPSRLSALTTSGANSSTPPRPT